jgi:hypothetical protein
MRRALYGVFALSLIACGGGGSTTQGSTCDPCGPSDPSEQAGAPVATNPYGDRYPTVGLGYRARGIDSLGNLNSKPGDVIPNHKFLGYPKGDTSGGLKPVQLADYYNPDGKGQWKILHISVAAYWCGPCNMETDAVVTVAAQLKQEGVAFIQAINDGPVPGKPATKSDLDSWIGRHKSNFTEALDPEQVGLGRFFPAPAFPLNVHVDARNMEILNEFNGAPQDQLGQVSGQAVLDDEDFYLAFVGSHPATTY